jgi:hypothetical protein
MKDTYITDYTREEVAEILKTIQTCVANGKFLLSQNSKRAENVEFLRRYNLTATRIQHIISEIVVTDFCHGLRNEHAGYEHEVLYVFCPQVELFYEEALEAVDIYAKFNVIDGERVIVISFHPRNFPIDYLFTV